MIKKLMYACALSAVSSVASADGESAMTLLEVAMLKATL